MSAQQNDDNGLMRELENYVSLLMEAEKCTRPFAVYNDILIHPISSALLDEQQERVSAASQARASYNRAFAEWKAQRELALR